MFGVARIALGGWSLLLPEDLAEGSARFTRDPVTAGARS